MKYQIDVSAPHCNLALAVCSCGSRFLAVSELAALDRLAAHERQIHPNDRNVRDALRKRKQRKSK